MGQMIVATRTMDEPVSSRTQVMASAARTTSHRPRAWNRAAQTFSQFRLLPYALIVLAVSAVYASSLTGSFVFDDQKQILENPFVLNAHLWTHIFTTGVWSFNGTGYAANFYRPLMIFSFWLIDRLAGPVPAFFHLFQLIVFAATACVVYTLGVELGGSRLAAFVAALLWALHPQRVEAAAWISALCDTGCGLFFVLAFWFFLRAERSRSHRLAIHWTAAASFFLALLFKEMAVSLPLLILAWWFFTGDHEAWRARAPRFAPYVAAGSAYLVARRLALGHLLSVPHSSISMPGLLLSAVALFGGHTRLFFHPVHLSPFRVFHPYRALLSPWPWLALGSLLATFIWRRKAPTFSFLVFWWPLTLAPCLDVKQLSVPLLADRFTYIPAVGLCLAIALAGTVMLPAWKPERGWLQAAAVAALAVAAISWAARSYANVAFWHGDEALIKHSLKESPGDPSLHLALACKLEYHDGDLAGAAQEFRTAIRLNRASLVPRTLIAYQAEVGLGTIALSQGRRQAAIARFNDAIHMAPGMSDAYMSLGSVYFPRGDYANAANHFSKAVKRAPYNTSAHFYLGTCLMKLGEYQAAAQQFRTARQVDPSFWQAYQAEAQALDRAGEGRTAAKVLKLVSKHRRR